VDLANTSDVTAETASCILRDVQIRSLTSPVIKTFEPVEIRVQLEAKVEMKSPGLYVSILNLDGQRIAGMVTNDMATFPPFNKGEVAEMGFTIERFPLLAGEYDLELQFRDPAEHKLEFVPKVFRFTVVETPVYGARSTEGGWFGNVALQARPFCEPAEFAGAQSRRDKA
jgi:hypothetical protein